MDLAYYLIELLGQRGEVSIPGLGRFYYARANAFYNDDEARVYPPGQTLAFEQRPVSSNDTFAEFISEKKNISMASAKYFVDRYVNDIVLESAIRDFAVADKGWLRNEGSKIVFRNANNNAGSKAYFGLPAIDLPKKGEQPVVKTTTVILTPPPPVIIEPQEPALPPVVEEAPVIEQTPVVEQPEVIEPAAVTPQPEPVIVPPVEVTEIKLEPATQFTDPVMDNSEIEYVEDEKRGLNVWVITAIVIALLAVAGIGLYMYNPQLLGMGNKPAAPVPVPVTDTLANQADTPKTDTTSVAPAGKAADTSVQDEAQQNMSLNDTVKTTVINPQPETEKQPEAEKPAAKEAAKPSPEKAKPTTVKSAAPAMGYPYTVIIGGSFANVEEAERCIANYKKLGLEAHVLAEPGYGKKRKVVVGTYKTKQEALEQKNKLIQSNKLREDAYTLEITKKQ